MKTTTIYNKLVRDNIPNIINSKNKIPVYYTLNEDQYWEALINKDMEELEEVKKALSKEEIKEELADKLEVLIAMAKHNGFSLEEIIVTANSKRKERGSFNNKIFLKKVIE